jgi:hypothetical protein
MHALKSDHGSDLCNQAEMPCLLLFISFHEYAKNRRYFVWFFKINSAIFLYSTATLGVDRSDIVRIQVYLFSDNRISHASNDLELFILGKKYGDYHE